MLVAGLEPARTNVRQILSLLRLPIPPYQQIVCNSIPFQSIPKDCKNFYQKSPVKSGYERNDQTGPLDLKSLVSFDKWMGVDSNHRSNLQQIYSLSPLATREPIHISYIILTKKIVA